MTATFGLGLALSNVKSIFSPFLLYAVMGGIAVQRFQRTKNKSKELDLIPNVSWRSRFRKRCFDICNKNITNGGWLKGSNKLSPAAAMSLKRGCEERPSRRKEGWDVATEGAGVGTPGKRRQQHTRALLQENCTVSAARHCPTATGWASRSRGKQTRVYSRYERASYRLARGHPADRAALLQRRPAWWARWSGLLAPRRYHRAGLIDR